MTEIHANRANLSEVCKAIQSQIAQKTHAIFLLQGDIGAGKTSLVQAFCAFLGVRDSITSPTFNLLHIYENAPKKSGGIAESSSLKSTENAENERAKIFHYDLYNRALGDLLALGILDLIEKKGVHFIEWGDENLLKILAPAFENIFLIRIEKIKNARIYFISSEF